MRNLLPLSWVSQTESESPPKTAKMKNTSMWSGFGFQKKSIVSKREKLPIAPNMKMGILPILLTSNPQRIAPVPPDIP